MIVSKEQERAKKAWELVNTVPTGAAEKYKSLVKSAPVMILTNGLGQTLAFILSKVKGQNEYLMLYSHLQQWLGGNIPWSQNSKNHDNLIERIMYENSQINRMATEEALSFLSWVKRFASARIPDKAEDDE